MPTHVVLTVHPDVGPTASAALSRRAVTDPELYPQ
jgi:hypothetical protein